MFELFQSAVNWSGAPAKSVAFEGERFGRLQPRLTVWSGSSWRARSSRSFQTSEWLSDMTCYPSPVMWKSQITVPENASPDLTI